MEVISQVLLDSVHGAYGVGDPQTTAANREALREKKRKRDEAMKEFEKIFG